MVRTSRKLLLAAVCVATTSAGSSTPHIFSRSCATTGYSQCSQAGLPPDFCCGPNTDCIALAGNTTVLCCPSKQSCNTIQAITCEIQLQDNSIHPENSLKTTALTGTLPTCGNQCCPFGYTCADSQQGVCSMNSDQSIAPATSSVSSSTPTSNPTSTGTSASSISIITPTNSNIPSQNTSIPIAAASCKKFPTGAVLAGFFPGMILGILLSAAGICLLGAHRRKQERRHSKSSSFGNNISEPQPNNLDGRSEFLRKPPVTPSTVQANESPRRQKTISRMRSMFRRSGPNNDGLGLRTMPGGGAGGRPPVPIPMRSQHKDPVTPPLQREPSYENINIFADGDTASALRQASRERGTRASHQTTFTDMMNQSGLAGLQKGQRKSTQNSIPLQDLPARDPFRDPPTVKPPRRKQPPPAFKSPYEFEDSASTRSKSVWSQNPPPSTYSRNLLSRNPLVRGLGAAEGSSSTPKPGGGYPQYHPPSSSFADWSSSVYSDDG